MCITSQKMDNKVDEDIREKIKDEQIEIPDSYYEKVNMTLNQLQGRKKQKIVKWKPSIAMAACAAIVLSTTVFATVNYYQNRMQSMSDTEKKEISNSVQNSDVDVDSFSRELSDEEKARFVKLEKEYTSQGRFPKESLVMVDDDSTLSEDKVALLTESSTFVLPNRQLNDEEILEIIDFYHKRDYSMQSGDKAKISKPKVDDNVKQLAIEKSKTAIKAFYGVDCTDYKVQAEADTEGGYRLEIVGDDKKYTALYDVEQEKILEIGCSTALIEKEDALKANETLFAETGKAVLDRLEKICGKDKIVENMCGYNITDEKEVPNAIVSFAFKTSDNLCYVVKYDYNVEEVTDLFVMSYEDYQQTIENNKKKQEERGIKHKEVVFEK